MRVFGDVFLNVGVYRDLITLCRLRRIRPSSRLLSCFFSGIAMAAFGQKRTFARDRYRPKVDAQMCIGTSRRLEAT